MDSRLLQGVLALVMGLAGCSTGDGIPEADLAGTLQDPDTVQGSTPEAPQQPHLSADTRIHTIRPAVFVRGERFADSLTVNDDATVLAVGRTSDNASVQVFLRRDESFIATEPVELMSATPAGVIDMASSASGDTLAVLLAGTAERGIPATLQVLERLGEAWLAVDELAIPDHFSIDTDSSVSVSSTAEHLLIGNGNGILRFHRSADQVRYGGHQQWLESVHITCSASHDFHYLHCLSLLDQQLWLTSHQSVWHAGKPSWTPLLQVPVQGFDTDDEVVLSSHADGLTMLIAGWESTDLMQRTPVAWRLAVHHSQPGRLSTSVSVRDSLRAAAVPEGTDAMLRFDASDDLERVAIGWQRPGNRTASISAFCFNPGKQRWQLALELPGASSMLADSAFADTLMISPDGYTLLLSAAASSTPGTDNRVGQVLVLPWLTETSPAD